jgi:anthranilate synthase component 1
MLIDLGRNDVGRISKTGTVEVTEKMVVERYSHVMHITSNVVGQVTDDMGAMEVLKATLPAGTLSGAPKIRAMEIIHDLEPSRRGVYSGAIGYFDFTGDMNTCIAIRTMVMKDGTVYFHSGAGIVYDSDPKKEFEETVNKAKAINSAIDLAENGLVD